MFHKGIRNFKDLSQQQILLGKFLNLHSPIALSQLVNQPSLDRCKLHLCPALGPGLLDSLIEAAFE